MRRRLADLPELERTSQLLGVAGSVVRLKLLSLLQRERELPVGELADRVGGSPSGVSQHLAKLRMYGLVATRREAQSQHYRLTDHPFNEALWRSLL